MYVLYMLRVSLAYRPFPALFCVPHLQLVVSPLSSSRLNIILSLNLKSGHRSAAANGPLSAPLVQ